MEARDRMWATVLKVLCVAVVALMAVTVVYVGWIVFNDYDRIAV